MRFSFTGTLGFTNSEKRPLIREGTTKRGTRYKSLSLFIAAGANNRGFVELLGLKAEGEQIRCRSTNGDSMKVDWSDRFDSGTLSTVSSMSKYVVGIGTERTEFLAPWDFIGYVQDNISDMVGNKYTITGRVRRDVYKGSVSNRFEIQGIYPASKEAKDQLRVTGEVYFTADDVDLADWKTERKITVNGYTEEWINPDEGRKLLAQSFVFDASKINPQNKEHVKVVKLKASDLGVEIDDEMNAKVVLKKKNVYKNDFICAYVNGAETIEFTEAMLTPYQRARIEAGAMTLDDYRPKGQVFGNRVVMLKIQNFSGKGKYENGIVLDEMKMSEFQDSIYQPELPTETAEDVLRGAMNPPEEEKVEMDVDELFI